MDAATRAVPTRAVPVGEASREEELPELTKDMFGKLAALADAECQDSCSEYELLRKLNGLATEKYEVMADKTETLASTMHALQEKYHQMAPFLAHVDQLDANIGHLEVVCKQLDDYTKTLETQFKAACK